MDIYPANLLDLNALRHVEAVCFPQDALAVARPGSRPDLPRRGAPEGVEAGRMIGFIAGGPRPVEGFSWIATLAVCPNIADAATGARCSKPVKPGFLRRASALSVQISTKKPSACTASAMPAM